MVITNKKQFVKGSLLAVVFFVILFVMFLPLFDGSNAFEASDKLFNSIAKGSTDYFPALKEEAALHGNEAVDVVLKISEKTTANDAVAVLKAAGMETREVDGGVHVTGTLGQMIEAALADAQAMYYNKGEEVSGRYDIPEKQVLFAWWTVLKETGKALTSQKRFAQTAMLDEVLDRGIAVGYNFYGIEPQDALSKAGILAFSLLFYVAYTLWWGYAIFFLFEGLGLQLTAGSRKET